jgi:hypothetical protein
MTRSGTNSGLMLWILEDTLAGKLSTRAVDRQVAIPRTSESLARRRRTQR